MSTQNLPAQTQSLGQKPAVELAQWKPRFEALALGLIILFCASLRIYHLGAASLWSDEIFSRYYVDLFGFRYVLTEGLSKETNPPTYYLLTPRLDRVVGRQRGCIALVVRSASILCVPVAYLLGRELGASREP